MTDGKMLPHVSVTILEEQVGLSLSEVSRACAVHAEMIVELVNEGVLAPDGREPHRWLFTGVHVRRGGAGPGTAGRGGGPAGPTQGDGRIARVNRHAVAPLCSLAYGKIGNRGPSSKLAVTKQ